MSSHRGKNICIPSFLLSFVTWGVAVGLEAMPPTAFVNWTESRGREAERDHLAGGGAVCLSERPVKRLARMLTSSSRSAKEPRASGTLCETSATALPLPCPCRQGSGVEIEHGRGLRRTTAGRMGRGGFLTVVCWNWPNYHPLKSHLLKAMFDFNRFFR